MRLLDTQSASPDEVAAALAATSILDQEEAEKAARAIVAEVRAGGDAAVRDCHRRFDGADLGELEVPRGAWEAARLALPSAVVEALEAARVAIEAFHQRQRRDSWEWEADGARMGERVTPLARIGIHVPAGKAR